MPDRHQQGAYRHLEELNGILSRAEEFFHGDFENHYLSTVIHVGLE